MKKFLSLFIVTVLLLSLAYVPVNANDSASGTILTHFDGVMYTSIKTTVVPQTIAEENVFSTDRFYSSNTSSGITGNTQHFLIQQKDANTGSKIGSGIKWTTENEDNYYVFNSSNVQSNYRTNLQEYLTGNTPVLSLSYDMRIPAESVDKSRKTTVMFTSLGTDTNNQSQMYINYDNGVFSAEPYKTTFTTVSSKTASYTANDGWVKVELRIYRTTDNKIDVGVYVGDKQIYYGNGTVTYDDGIASIRQLNFETEAVDNATFDTHYDDIIVSALPESYKPVDIVEEVVPVQTYLTHFDGKMYSNINTDDAQKVVDANEFSTDKIYASNVSSEIKKNPQHFLVAKTPGSGIKWTTENEDNYYVFNSSNVQSNFRTDLASYMTADTPVLSFSYDMRIPADSVDKSRKTTVVFASNASAGTDNSSTVYINYDDGAFSVDPHRTFTTVSSKTASYAANDGWVKVELRIYKTTENKINAGVYVGDSLIYYGTGNADYKDGIGIRSLNFETEVVEDSTFDTHYDDIIVDVLSSEYKPEPIIQLFLDYDEESSSVVSKAKINDGSRLCLVTAVFNNKGCLEKLWTDTTLDNGILTYTVSGSEYIKSGYIVKAFLFDTLQSAIPQINSKSLTLQ